MYDALNVLMAMDIISKDKKEIQWKGLPRTSLNDIEELKVGMQLLFFMSCGYWMDFCNQNPRFKLKQLLKFNECRQSASDSEIELKRKLRICKNWRNKYGFLFVTYMITLS